MSDTNIPTPLNQAGGGRVYGQQAVSVVSGEHLWFVRDHERATTT